MAVMGDGECYSGEQMEAKRAWYARWRQVLQSVGSHSARRRLRQLSGRQRRYQRDTNHCISKELVEVAQRAGPETRECVWSAGTLHLQTWMQGAGGQRAYGLDREGKSRRL